MEASNQDYGTVDNKALERIRTALSERTVADFSDLPEPQRRIPVEFLEQLISGAGSTIGELRSALRIRAAHIVGPLRPPTPSWRGERASLQFWECSFDAPVDLSGGEFLVLRFVDCSLPAFIGASLRVSADLDLSGSRFSGVCEYESELSQIGHCAVHLNNARIGGRLDLSSTERSRFTANGSLRLDNARVEGDADFSGALLDGGGEVALSARSATIGGNVELRPVTGHRFEAHGEVVFVAAQITGDLNCHAGRLINPTGRALHCEDLKVETVSLTASREMGLHFEARGRLNFLTAIIGGSLYISNARLEPGPDYTGLLQQGGPIAINLQQARISNALALNAISACEDTESPPSLDQVGKPVKGWFLLTGVSFTSLYDNMDSGWPEYGFLDLEGATYLRTREVDGQHLTSRRVAWLRRQYPEGKPSAESFRPQPYEQLALVLRQHGLAREANAIAVEKIRMRLAARVDGPAARAFPRLLMLISQHGYSTSRAITSFLVFVLLGAAMYATALFVFQQPFVPVEFDPSPVSYRLPFGLAEHSTAAGCPGLDVLHYALDTAMPVIDLSQDLRCRFTPEGPFRELWLMLHSLYAITGAALSAVVVLTLTGLLRQD